MTIVDAHHHLWDPATRDYPWMAGTALNPIRRSYTMSDLRSAAGPAVTATVLVQTVSSLAETEELLRIAYDSQGLVAGVVGWIDLSIPHAADSIARLRTLPGGQSLVGIRHQVEDEPDPDWLLREEIQSALRELANANLAYDLLVRAPQRPAAHTAAARCPEVTFVIDHAGKPDIAAGEWEPWASWIRDMAGLSNTMCKLSGLITQAPWDSWTPTQLRPYAEHVLDQFGANRVMFGSDWPVCELAGTYSDVLTLTSELLDGASPGERAAVLGTTATRCYALGQT